MFEPHFEVLLFFEKNQHDATDSKMFERKLTLSGEEEILQTTNLIRCVDAVRSISSVGEVNLRNSLDMEAYMTF